MTTRIRTKTATVASRALLNMPENEKLAAQHMKWWPVYLIREKRRLRGISDRVQSDELPEAQTDISDPPAAVQRVLEAISFGDEFSPDVEEASPIEPDPVRLSAPTFESPEELLLRLDAEHEADQALAALETDDDLLGEIAVEVPDADPEDTRPVPTAQGEAASALNTPVQIVDTSPRRGELSGRENLADEGSDSY